MTDRDDGCRAYRRINFTEERAQLIGWVRQTVERYGAQGMSVTVRQVYYRAVAEGLMPSSGQTYSKIQAALRDGRIAGLVPWDLVEDRGRGLRSLETWESPAQAVRAARSRYLRDLWASQPMRPEVWVEKAALEGVVGDICTRLRVDFYATRGYDSQSQQWRAGQRMADYVRRGQRPVVLYLGDHDPSGLDMTRDVAERLEMFAGVPVMVSRIALTRDQIDQYDPPPFDVKLSDSRGEAYAAEHGDEAWELDALDPSVLKDVISEAVGRLRDEALWNAALTEETEDQRELDAVVEGLGQ